MFFHPDISYSRHRMLQWWLSFHETMTMSDHSPSEASPMHAIKDQPCGHVLTSARLKKNLSIEAAAHHLKLSITQVRGLEEDDYPNKQISTFHKGYLKRYCVWLDLNITQLLESLRAHGFEMAQPRVYYRSESVKSHQNHLGGQTRLFNHSRASHAKRSLWRMTLVTLVVFWGITQWLMHGDLAQNTHDMHVIHAHPLPTPTATQPQTLKAMVVHNIVQPTASSPQKNKQASSLGKKHASIQAEDQDDG